MTTSRLAAATRRILAGLLLAISALLGVAPAASAHSQIVWSDPANGQRVEETPSSIRMILSEKPDLDRSTFELTQHDVAIPMLGTPRMIGEVKGDASTGIPAGAYEVDIPITRQLAVGVYRLGILMVSAEDGHKERSGTVFGIRMDVSDKEVDAQSIATLGQGMNPLRQVFTYGVVIAAGVGLGVALFAARCTGSVPGLRRVRIISEDVILGAGLSLGVLTVGAGAVRGWGLIIGSALGAGLLAAGMRGRGLPKVSPVATAFLGTTLAAGSMAFAGHAAGAGWFKFSMSATHLVATAIWSGLVIAALMLTRADRATRLEGLSAVSRFAGPAFGASVLSGLALAGVFIPSVGAVTSSSYGIGMLLKIALVAVIALLGWRMRNQLKRSLVGPQKVEAVLLALVALIGVMMATLPAPVGPQFAATPSWQPSDEPVVTMADDAVLDFQLTPNEIGNTYVVVNVQKSPTPITNMHVKIGDDLSMRVGKTQDGSWVARYMVTKVGPTKVTLSISRDGKDDAITELNYTVGAAPGMLKGGQPLAPWAGVAAGAFAVGLGGFFALERRGRRRDDNELASAVTDEDLESPEGSAEATLGA